MAQAKQGDSVKVTYRGTLADGTEFDSSVGQPPLEFTIGNSEVIPGFEQAVIGMALGESKTLTIPADLAYGPRLDEMIADVERSQIPAEIELMVGAQLEVSQEQGHSYVVMVAALNEETVTLDANHPLAGQDLTFEINLVEMG